MKLNRCKHLSAVAAIVLLLVSAQAQSPLNQTNQGNSSEFRFDIFRFALPGKAHRSSFSLMPVGASVRANPGLSPLAAGANLQVLGSGPIGRIPIWAGFTSSNSFLGASGIFESKQGNVGIGTDNPTAKLEVVGAVSHFAISAINTAEAGSGILAIGDSGSIPGTGVRAAGGDSTTDAGGGAGVSARGGNGAFLAGEGLFGVGGNSSSQGGTGVVAFGGRSDFSSPSIAGTGVVAQGGRGFNGGHGVLAVAGETTGDGAGGIAGSGVSGSGGRSTSGRGGFGLNGSGGRSDSGTGGAGVRAEGGDSTSGAGGIGLLALPGVGPLGDGLAGRFEGNVEITGTLTKGGGMFKIDHPLDPANKYLSHSFVESPDMKNVYDGVAVLDRKGEAVVKLPDYFQALNRDFRYQLTAVGSPGPRLYIAQEISANQFKIAGGRPGMKVCWLVTGIRHDPWAERRPIVVEEEKPERERGSYLHPEAYRVAEEKGARKRAILR